MTLSSNFAQKRGGGGRNNEGGITTREYGNGDKFTLYRNFACEIVIGITYYHDTGVGTTRGGLLELVPPSLLQWFSYIDYRVLKSRHMQMNVYESTNIIM